jgi:uncharacterized protein
MGDQGQAGLEARLELVDILRGFALSGLFLVHMIESYELYWSNPVPGPIADTVYLLFMGKSFSLLALCFGFSFYILMARAARRGVDFSARFAWRLTCCGDRHAPRPGLSRRHHPAARRAWASCCCCSTA